MFLYKEAEVKTLDNSYCTLAFDEELKNILTIKENSHIEIKNVKPGDIFLPEGRVFTLIKSLSKYEQFQIRTPTAIAGSRGTGWLTSFINGQASIFCFIDTVYVMGLDSLGNVTGQKDLASSFGLIIGDGGLLGEIFPLSDKDKQQWSDFINYVDSLTEESEQEMLDIGSSQELRQEQQEDLSQISQETRRQDEEGRASGSQEIPR